jgi:hypothetical protein
MLAGLVALMLAAIFTGAALYVSFVEQPARMLLETKAALAQWQPSYKRGAVMQAGLAVIAFLAGVSPGGRRALPGGRGVPDPALALDPVGDPAHQQGPAGDEPRPGRAGKPCVAGKMGQAACHAHGFGLRRRTVFPGGLFDFPRFWGLKPACFPESHRSFRSPARRGGSTPGSALRPLGFNCLELLVSV